MASPAPANDPILLEDFGQTVDLTRRIREVLLNYPEGTTVLKELVQNADDADATKVCLCLDRRIHGSESLLSDSLEQFQGPALLAYNNALFTEEDFVSISRIGGSNKHGQAWKTGRFGVGFNSVYHLTELPSFVSGKYMVMFDPQGVYLPKVSTANPGKRIDFVHSSAISRYSDQFLPYCAFGCDMKNSFAGTLFRLPLRNADQAARSRLSRQAYCEDDISSMFVELYAEGVLTLLFLKSLLCIEMYEWNDEDLEPRKLYSCSVISENNDIAWHRQALLRLSKSINSTESEMDSFLLEFLSEATRDTQVEKKIDKFFIVQIMAAASSRMGSFASSASKEYDIHLLPWASIAACISDDSHSSSNNVLQVGRAFCFLPLPVRTGLRVQVNGYFEVASNRRGIWYGADMDRSGKIRSVWNRLLLEDVVASAFIELLQGVQELVGPTNFYYSLWPSGSFEEPWSFLVEHVYRKIGEVPVLYSDFEGGNWVSPARAFLHDEEFTKSQELGEALMLLGMPIVHLPNHISSMLLKFSSTFQQRVVTSNIVRQFLREHKAVSVLGRHLRLVLLEYCLEDLIDDDVGTHAYELPLLPLANGDFGMLSEASKGISYFICDELEYKLLQQISYRVIDYSIPHNILKRLTNIAKSSKANIAILNIHEFLQIFPKIVPAAWKYKNKVKWDPGSCTNHPTSSWFLLFWQYLRNQCDKLSLFADWPILPSVSGHLYRPSRQSKMINGDVLSDPLRQILIRIGCKLLNTSYKVDHPDLFHYVSDGNCAGVMNSIFDVVSSNGGIMPTSFHNLEMEERDVLRGFLIDPKWYIGDSMESSKIKGCKKLPIYKVYNEGSAEYFQFSNLENQKYLPPKDVAQCFLGNEFIIRSSASEEEILSRYYGVKRMGMASFYRKCVLNRVGEIQPEVRDSTMLSLLVNLPQLCVEDVSLSDCLSKLEFIPTLSGTLKRPSELYDPRNEELYALLDDFDSFPYGPFNEARILDMLHCLGLRTSISLETVLLSARNIERMTHVDHEKAHSRGKVLLSYLEVNAIKWLVNPVSEDQGRVNRMFSQAATAFRPRNLKSDLEKFWNDLRMICWCPVLVSAPFETLPWPAVSSMVAPPKLVRLPTDLWLVSASMRILDGECSSSALSYSLGWSASPGGGVIAAQLLELGKNNELLNNQVLRQELALAMPKIYSILFGLIGSDEMDIVKTVLDRCRWIWVGDGFATTDEVALDSPIHLAPYIRVIPIDLAVFKALFLELGIREFLKPTDYASILHRMALRKGSSPLNSQEIRAAILITQHLVEVPFPDEHIDIYIPDVSGILCRASDLVYNDAPWFLSSEDTGCSFGGKSTPMMSLNRTVHKFVHGNISNEVAEKLGVCSLRRILLAESADSMNLSLSEAAEAFGQHEALTTRLRHILEMYADGPGILFELVQNAEDAGASEVIFLLDKTQYGTSSVLSPEMAEWQGPALYCFNDSVFSPQDLYAISRIGQESKLEKPFAIGRFGLGFNCVYHFTDIPMFVSGENIVIFDPHACNLPGISPSHPGLRIKFVGRRILEQFPDQFSPFLHFGCNLQHQFPGTLFRFPLRSANVASRSQIRKEAYAPEDVSSLFTSFAQVVSDTLLFLHNVKSVSIFVKDETGPEMKCLHRVHKNYINDVTTKSNALQDIFNTLYENQRSEVNKKQILKRLSESIDRDLPYKCQKIVIREQSPAKDILHCWITSECLGGGPAKINTSGFNDKSYNFVPWASVAAYIHSIKVDDLNVMDTKDACLVSPDLFQAPTASLQSQKSFEGHAFCFLPLPIITCLPVHVNGYFELSSNRRDIWFGNDMVGGGKLRSDWNIYLLKDVVAPAYGRLLEKLAYEIGQCDLFFSFWPTTTGIEPWASLVRNLYTFIADFGLQVLHTKARRGRWISTKQAIFPDFSFHKGDELVEALSNADLPVVTVPKVVVERFMEMRPLLHFLTPHLLRTLLARKKRSFKNRNATILTLEYCIIDLALPSQSHALYGLSLLPLVDGSFTSFDKNGKGERIYVAREDEYGLLKDSIPNQLVDSDIPEEVYRKLCNIAHHEDSNISFLSCHLLEELFLKLIPAEWHQSRHVTWVPGHHGQPSLEWMRLLWCYLKSNCEDLLVFSKWPILPVGKNSLLQLVENSNVIKDDGWSENMSSLLQKVGCLFLRHDFPIDHPDLEKFVQPPTATGVLNAFLAIAGEPEKIEGLFVDALEGELHELRSFILQSKWFGEEEMGTIHIDALKHIPMFESYRSRKLVILSKPRKLLKPADVREDLLDDDFIRIESEKERTILKRYIDVEEPSRLEFYKDYVLNHMSEFVKEQEVISTILRDMKLLIEEDISIKSALSTTPFVLAANGSWQQPSKLYDPRVPEIRMMLYEKVFFPSDKFCDNETLDTLVILGLQRTLGFTGLLDCAKSVSLLHDLKELETLSYAKRLLACLDSLASKLSIHKEGNYEEPQCSTLCNNNCIKDGDTHMESVSRERNYVVDDLDIEFLSTSNDDIEEEMFWSEMKGIAWCPVCVDSPLKILPWFQSSTEVAAPNIVRPKSQMWMVSYSMHILDGECCSKYLQHKLGWLDSPNLKVLSAQLVEISKLYGELSSHSLVEPDFNATLQKEIPLLYSKLQEYVDTDHFMELKSALSGVPWIWVGDAFVSPDELAFDSPVKFTPYLYVVPSEISEFRDLLLNLGVKLCFEDWKYFHVLQRLYTDIKGFPLSMDQLSFVRCVLEVIADSSSHKPLLGGSNTSLLIPDSSGTLTQANDLVYNDAPWMESNIRVDKRFIHPSISNDLASKLGVQSLRCLSLVDEDMTKELPCMDFSKINELHALYGNNDFLLFDLLELADCCKAKKLHLIFDKREHPRQSLLQHNLGDFQGPALVAIFEEASLGREEVNNLQFLPPWRIRGDILNYGLGLLSCYFVCDLLSIISGGLFYMFDPRGLALSIPSSSSPAAKMFSLLGTNIMERFCDQFNPMLLGQNMSWSIHDSTIIRMPLSRECMKDGKESGFKRIKGISDKFLEHASRILLFLKSVTQVSMSTWEEGSLQPCQDYMVCIDSSSTIVRNPFSEKKWKKFQISRLFSNSNAVTKMHVIDVLLHQGETRVVDRWLVVLSLGSGQSRNMALDRRYLAYNLTPVAGVAARLSSNNQPVEIRPNGSIMSPLPLTGIIDIPVTIVGCFLVRHNGGRYLFKYQDREIAAAGQFDAGDQLIEDWNRELMACVCDSYIQMVFEIHKLRKDPAGSSIESSAGHAISSVMKAYGDQIYSFWPRSNSSGCSKPSYEHDSNSIMKKVFDADWECLIQKVIRPFYTRAVDLPVWQLYSGKCVKAEEGMFLAQPGSVVGGNLLPNTVCSFVKEHYPVFLVPWELLAEIQAVGVSVREVNPNMVRDLLRDSSAYIVLQSVETYLDVLEYCLSDIKLSLASNQGEDDIKIDSSNVNSIEGRMNFSEISSASISFSDKNSASASSMHKPAYNENSSGDALEMMTSLGKALIGLGRGVVEDIGKPGRPLSMRNTIAGSSNRNRDQKLLSVVADLKGLPCPTATNNLLKLGVTDLWLGNRDQQRLMMPLAAKFIHPKLLDRPILANIFSFDALQGLLKLQKFSLSFLANNMKKVFHDNWASHVMGSNMAPWFSWDNTSCSGVEGGPSPEWILLFWKQFDGSSENLLLFSDWPLIPAFLGRPVLCRLRERNLVFITPPFSSQDSQYAPLEMDIVGTESDVAELSVNHTDSEFGKPYISAFETAKDVYPWLFSFLNQCNIPVFDITFIECALASNCLPTSSQSLGQVIAFKLVAAKRAGYFPEIASLTDSNRNELLTLFARDFLSSTSAYGSEELEVLRTLPIYKTVVGSHTRLHGNNQCLISSSSFLKAYDEHCFSYATDSMEYSLLKILGVSELHDRQILVRFCLPGFEDKTASEQEDILIYVYANWQDLQEDVSVTDSLKETKFVKNADEGSIEFSKPKELFDPSDVLLASVFFGEKKKFPGERFCSDGWLNILRKTGLRNATEADIILECAKRIEFLGSEWKKCDNLDDFELDSTSAQSEASVEILALAGSVVESIFSNFAVLYSNNFCNLLGKIAFIPAELGFPNLGGKRGGKRVLTSYSDAIISKDWPLAWSCVPIISSRSVIPPEYSWGALNLRSPPDFATILKHLQVIGRNGGEDTLAHWPIAVGIMTIDEASCEILKYLNKVWGSLSSSDMLELRKVAFIPVANGTRLVTANSLFVHLSINLSPFAFELPSLYLPFVKLLKDLGLQDVLLVSSAKDLLSNVQATCGYQRLNPNELRAVMEILRFICNDSAEVNDSNNGSLWESEAIVPDDGCRLVHAKSCTYIDSYGSRLVKTIDTSRLRFVHQDLPERICTILGIKKLSDLVREELDHEECLENLEYIGAVSLIAIRERLVSRSFHRAVWKIFKSIASYTSEMKNLDAEDVEKSLQCIANKLQFVKTLYTHFFLLPKFIDITRTTKDSMIPEWENGQHHRALFFVNFSNACICVAEPPHYISVLDILAIVVSQIVGSPTPLPIASLFLCPEGSEDGVVNVLKLPFGKKEIDSFYGSNSLAGKEILPQDALQVQFHPLRPFYAGEIVAWRSQIGEKLKYGRVLEDAKPSAGQALYRLKVETAPGVIQSLLSSLVLSFKTIYLDKRDSSASFSEGSSAETNSETFGEVAESSRRMKSVASQRPVTELQYGKVSAAEMAQAVHEILAAAGINMDMERHSLLKNTIILEEQLRESQATLLLEQEKSETSAKEAEMAKAAWICRVCLSAEVTMTIIPCGHVLCHRCSSAVAKCPFCRRQTTKTMRLFRP